MNNLILVRHGQSLWNLERRFTGWADIDLTKHGKLEAKYAGKLINELNIEFHAYFTSQLKRAINTLKIILEILSKENVEIVKRVNIKLKQELCLKNNLLEKQNRTIIKMKAAHATLNESFDIVSGCWNDCEEVLKNKTNELAMSLKI